MGLKDFFGRLFKEAAKPEIRELGAVSLAERWSTYPSVGLTPNRLAEIFREADLGDVYRQMELFEEMEEKDAHLASLLQTRKLAVLSKDYEILPYSKNPEDQAIAEFVGEVVYGIANLEEALLDLLDGIGKGFALSEIIWDLQGGRARVAELKWIPQKKVTFRESLGPRLLTPKAPWQGEDAAALEGDLPSLQGPQRPRLPGRGAARGGLDVPAEEFRPEGLGRVQRGLRHAAEVGEVRCRGLSGGPGGPAAGRAPPGVRRRRSDQQVHRDRVRGGGFPGGQNQSLPGHGGFLQPGDVQGGAGADPDHAIPPAPPAPMRPPRSTTRCAGTWWRPTPRPWPPP